MKSRRLFFQTGIHLRFYLYGREEWAANDSRCPFDVVDHCPFLAIMVPWLQSFGWVDFFVGFDIYFSFPKMEHLKFMVIARRSGFLFRDKLAVTFFGVYHG